MGKGLGKWQQLIIEALNKAVVVPVSRMAVVETGGSLFPEEYNALNRAAHTLAKKGIIGLTRCFATDYRGQENVKLLAVRISHIDILRQAGANVVSVPQGTESTFKSRRMKNSIRDKAYQAGLSKSTVHRMESEESWGSTEED